MTMTATRTTTGRRIGRAYDPGIGWGRGEHGILLIAARVFGLCGFVVAAPLLDVLGANPTFFVAHNVDGGSLVLFGLAVILIPAVGVANAKWVAVALDGRIAGTGLTRR